MPTYTQPADCGLLTFDTELADNRFAVSRRKANVEAAIVRGRLRAIEQETTATGDEKPGSGRINSENRVGVRGAQRLINGIISNE